MTFKRILRGIQGRLKRLSLIPGKLCNTFYYYTTKKDNILIVNAPLFQFLNRVRSFNFGDDLNYYLLKELSGKKVLAYWSFYHLSKTVPNVMAIGSVIDWLGNSQTTVWGSGILFPPKIQTDNHKYLVKKVVAVRGAFTRNCLLKSGVDCPEVYGDPALLLPLIYHPNVEKVKGRIGFIPHYADLKDENISRLMKECGKNAFLIRIRGYRAWQDVIRQILSCEFIVSSSLHGLILSDAYDVPNLWISLPKELPGGAFKFNDYYSSVGKTPVVYKINPSTSIGELYNKKQDYQRISYNPIPLLKACPFTITNPAILELIKED